jgi:CheY-like chemotaxis protein
LTLGLADIRLSLSNHELLDTLSATAVGMQHMITRYLEYSKVENGIPLVPTLSRTDLQDSLRTISRMFELLTVSHTLLIDCTESVQIMMDRQWFEENILAFISNALKYTAPCPLVLAITLTETRLRLVLTDEGPYLDPVTKASLFQVFSRGPAPSKAGGCGLGLYSVSVRITTLGGVCGVEDRQDTIPGSGFWFEMPIERVSVVVPGQATLCLDVLVVDDTLITRKVMSRMLGRLGHRVSLAVNGVDALARMRAKRWDVVVMDLQMPVMGGEEATRLFRADEVVCAPLPRMRIICSTANTEWCHDPSLFDAVLFKPFTQERCVQSLYASGACHSPSKQGDSDPSISLFLSS